MKTYRCKHAVEAMRWTDTAENREAFAAWFETHNAMFTTRGAEVVLPEEGTVAEGEWILYSDGEFIVMEDDLFTLDYEEVTPAVEPLCAPLAPALWAACEEPADEAGAPACGWTGEMSQLLVESDGVTHCPNCGSTAIREDLVP